MITLTLDSETEKHLEALGARDDQEKARLARQMLRQAIEQLAALRSRVSDEIEAAFSEGSGRVWGDAEWEALLRGEYRYEPEENNWATPPGWRSPRAGSKS